MKIPARGMTVETMLRYILLLALFFGFVAQSVLAADGGDLEGRESRTLRVVMDNNYPPYVFLDGKGNMQGILVDQWQLWQKVTGIRVEIRGTDWSDALRGMRAGEYDVIDTIFKTEERSGWLDFTRPYARLEVPIFFNNEISGISNINSLKGFVVAAKEGDAAVDHLRDSGIENLVLFKGYEDIIRAAKEHKVNVFVIDKPPALYFLYKYAIQQNYRESPPIDVGEFHRAVKKGNSTLLQEIEAGFARMPAKKLQEIEKKWYGAPVQKIVPARHLLTGIGILCLLILALFSWNRSLKRAIARRTLQLKTSEERYRHLFNSESDAIVVVDVETLAHVEVNEAAAVLYGYSHDELMALHAADLSTEPEETWCEQMTNGVDAIRMPLRYHRKKDGTVFPVEIAARFFVHDGRKMLLAAMRDISDRLRAEETLRENRRFLHDLIENSGALIFVKDLEGRYQLVNRRWEEVLGLHRDQILGKRDEELFPGPIGSQFRRNDLAVIESNKNLELEEILEDEYGRRVFLSVKFPLRSENGQITGICGMTTEITERKHAEEDREKLLGQLSQSRKMESIGRLAGGIAHDYNNMLGVILGHTELALLQVPASANIHGNLKEIEKAARRSADLTRQLLAFARKQTVMPKILDLNEMVAGMFDMLRRLIGEDIDLVWSPGEDIWPVKMDPTQLDQILANLCANARDSIVNVGKVSISTENLHVSEEFCMMHEGCVAGDFVMLSVTDTGCGMEKESLSLLFEPFYTTKELGKGTGLGLATVYGIVQQNKGFIKVDSEKGRGTTFMVCLPRHDETLVLSEKDEARGELVFGRETVLLVEDEPAILAMAMQMLEKMGYRVLIAETPEAALRLAEEHPGGIDLLMTDVIMPKMNGWELSRKLLEIRPEMKLLFTSGYTADVMPLHSVLDEDVHFIQKPFTLQELSVKVRLALDMCRKNGRRSD